MNRTWLVVNGGLSALLVLLIMKFTAAVERLNAERAARAITQAGEEVLLTPLGTENVKPVGRPAGTRQAGGGIPRVDEAEAAVLVDGALVLRAGPDAWFLVVPLPDSAPAGGAAGRAAGGPGWY